MRTMIGVAVMVAGLVGYGIGRWQGHPISGPTFKPIWVFTDTERIGCTMTTADGRTFEWRQPMSNDLGSLCHNPFVAQDVRP